ncbi:MAG: UDP-N-acetylglucosamine O-acyltransferase [Deltaproteobacteria bacterium]|nr:UDP-N-acetylglucosamine O-acyltransferase [Deltaproteobacteria bacterium]
MNNIHPTAIIDEKAELGNHLSIGPYCLIGAEVELGDGCQLKSHVVVDGPCRIGSENIFFPFSIIGGDPQDLKFNQEKTQLIVGSNNTFREGVSVHRGTIGGGGKTLIGNSNLLMGYVHVAHDCRIGNNNILANYTGLSGHVTLDDYVTLGGQNGVAQFLNIGSFVYTGAGSLIDRNVPPYSTGYGNRFEVKGVNIVGLKRQKFSREQIAEILETHRIYYRSELKNDEALRVIEETFGESDAVRTFIDFIYSMETSGKL